LPWVGDALHLLFVLASLAWTFAALALPSHFSFPLALYMMPLAAFCLAKLVIGPLLYSRRVACSWKGIVGAAVAGMGLSHAIARGVVAGLWGRSHVFHVTGKGSVAARKKRWRLAVDSVREEAMLFLGLTLAIIAVAVAREPEHRESLFWIGMLVLQCMPYLAAMLCAWAASWCEASRGSSAQAVQERHTLAKT
jgi:hypothetical protein